LCSDICEKLNEAPGSAVEQITEALELLSELYPFYDSLQGWKDELGSTRSILGELNRTLLDISREIRYNPEKVEENRLRVTALTGFQKRWNCEGSDLGALADDLRNKLDGMSNLDAEVENLEAKIADDEEHLIEIGKKLSLLRMEAARKLETQVHDKLAFIAMEKARFRIEFDSLQLDDPYTDGLDKVEFQLSPDGKISYNTLSKVASGGEMSRILLALKSSLATVDDIDSLIFDEIDQGISGRVARLVGQQLFELARERQVIVVTHLPQIASLGELHLSVRHDGDSRTATVHALGGEERLEELAALLTATGLSDGALLNAREMLESAQKLRAAS